MWLLHRSHDVVRKCLSDRTLPSADWWMLFSVYVSAVCAWTHALHVATREGTRGRGLGDEKLSIPSQIGMDLSRITTCMSPCAELHRSSQPCDQWSSDGDDQLISILITGTAAVAVYCTLLAERLRIRICWRSAPVICTSPHYKLCVILLTNLWLNCSVGLKPAGLLLRVGLKNYINIYMQIYLY